MEENNSTINAIFEILYPEIAKKEKQMKAVINCYRQFEEDGVLIWNGTPIIHASTIETLVKIKTDFTSLDVISAMARKINELEYKLELLKEKGVQ